jgi:hypothetical protein
VSIARQRKSRDKRRASDGLVRMWGRSGVKGVCWTRATKKWRVIRYVSGKQIDYGSFFSFEDAKKRNDEIPFTRKTPEQEHK